MCNTYTTPEGTARAGILGGRRAAPCLRPLPTVPLEERPREAQLQTPRGQRPFPVLMPGPRFPAWASVPNVEWKHLWGSGRVTAWIRTALRAASESVHLCCMAARAWARGPTPAFSCSMPEPRLAPWRRGHRRGHGAAMAPDPHRHCRAPSSGESPRGRVTRDRRGAPSPPPSDPAQPLCGRSSGPDAAGRLGSQHGAAPGALGGSWAQTGKLPGPALRQGDTSRGLMLLAQQRGLARVPRRDPPALKRPRMRCQAGSALISTAACPSSSLCSRSAGYGNQGK